MQESRAVVPGDVIFVSARDFESAASRYIQTEIDPDAKNASRCFAHVGLVISKNLALEAVPAPNPEEPKNAAFTLRDTVEVGKWSGAELRGGVRLTPIADLVVPATEPGADLVALRSTLTSASELSPVHASVLKMLGSGYSIEVLKRRAQEVFPEQLAKVASRKATWLSVPQDMATRLGLDPETRKRMEAALPDLVLPAAARTYYCSQAVIACLATDSRLPLEVTSDLTTPTGLYRLLVERGWEDVTEIYRCSPDTDRYLEKTRMDTDASYTASLATVSVGINNLMVGTIADVQKAQVQAAEMSCARVLEALQRLQSSTPPRHAPGKSNSEA